MEKDSALFWKLVISFLLVVFFELNYFVYPALQSTYYNCLPNSTETYSQNPNIAGAVLKNSSGVFLYINPSINKNSIDYQITLNHEMCHVRQWEENRAFDCRYKIGMFINEMECYVKQHF